MDPTVIALIGTISGAAIGGVVGVATTLVQARSTRRTTELQVRVQIELAERQRFIQAEIDRSKRMNERREEAYRHLGLWLDEIQAAMEKVHAALFSTDELLLSQAVHIVDEWPFETLRAPKYTAETRYLWSDRVETVIGEVSAASSDWHTLAYGALLRSMSHEIQRRVLGESRAATLRQHFDADTDLKKNNVWIEQKKVSAELRQVRIAMREEMLTGSS